MKPLAPPLIRILAATLACLFLSACGKTMKLSDDDGDVARENLYYEALELFQNEEFQKLDALAASLTNKKRHYLDGGWRVNALYRAIKAPGGTRSESDWLRHFERIDRWMTRQPDSRIAPVAKGMAYIRHAWKARGGGYAHTVTEEGWKLFSERQDKAAEILMDFKKRHPNEKMCPGWHDSMLELAQGQSWGRARYDALFDEAVQAWPKFYTLYFSKAFDLLPRWHGDQGDWLRFAEDAGLAQGDEMYARICVYMTRWVGWGKLFKEENVSWERMKSGFEEMRAKYPRSATILNMYCHAACMARDKATAGRLFQEMGDAVCPAIWDPDGNPEQKRYHQSKTWALYKYSAATQ
ncbi:MAG: DUF4034 domain-containing protein [Opitutaceae bacterium]|jgi:hypothetical protein|nr:DUF4034 domain-containing protein [Opitutaceae bacterium]